MLFPKTLKKELVLEFGFKRVGTTWKLLSGRPSIIRVAVTDCSRSYRRPRLLGNITDPAVIVRIYDEAGVGTDSPTLIGDCEEAIRRCGVFLDNELSAYRNRCLES